MNKPNRLAQESSPYLLQHAHNPVDWYPWGTEALGRAKRESKPIFLSIGYSACHWCHVMERESFEDPETAKVLNDHFISIKVDREERPDLDHIYMSAVQAMTQHGGWPMSVFLTPDLEPFYGGTYFPPEDRMGMPAFRKVLAGVATAWKTKREDVTKSAKQLVSALSEMTGSQGKGDTEIDTTLLDQAVRAIVGNFDAENGGFGTAPKFFHTMDLKVCLRQWKRTGDETALGVVTVTLDKIMRAGIYDQLGHGFHRYSTDQQWLVPHFEKMLYDNALLAELYLEAYQATRKPEYEKTAREVLNYVLREMTSPDGGFYSTQDADSEGVEGKFYVWSKKEIESLLDADLAEKFCRVHGVTEQGNWEGHNILTLAETVKEEWLEESIAVASRKLFAAREQRPKPFRDEKILVSWNGLMIHAMALGHQVLGDERYQLAAQNAANFILERMGAKASGTGPLQHVYKDNRARVNAFVDDYGSLANALVTMFESDFDSKWLVAADGLARAMIGRFWDDEQGGFFFTPNDHEKLISRPKENHDGATPSGTSLAVTAMLRLGKLTGNNDYLSKAERTLSVNGQMLKLLPTAHGQLLCALDWFVDQAREIVFAPGSSDEENETVLALLRRKFDPTRVLAAGMRPHPLLNPLTGEKRPVGGRATVYVCENFACQAPLVGLEAVEKAFG